MAEYVYHAATDESNYTDFENNYESSCVKVEALTIAQTAFFIEKSYTDFKALITGDISWGDVKYVEVRNNHDLYLVSSTAL